LSIGEECYLNPLAGKQEELVRYPSLSAATGRAAFSQLRSLPWRGLIPAQWAGGAGEGTRELGASAEGKGGTGKTEGDGGG